MEQLIANAHNTNTLTSIAECLRTTDKQHVVVSIASHSGLIWSLERFRQVLAEVHCKVSQVFHHYSVVLCSQFTNNLQFFLTQANPRWVVGVTVNYGADVALTHVALEFSLELIATIVVHVEGLELYAHNLQLHLLHRESWVYKQHGVLLLVALRTGKEAGECSLHRARNRHTALRLDIYTNKCLNKLRCSLFQHWCTLNIWVAVGNTVLQSFYLGINAHLSSRQTWNTHLHLDELYSTGFL